MCRTCNVAANIKLVNGKPAELICSQCGETEDYEIFLSGVSATMASKAQDMFRKAFAGSKSVTYRATRIPLPKSKFRLSQP